MTERSKGISVWSGNKGQDVGLERCQTEGRYRYVEPVPRALWEQPPELPVLRKLDMTAGERLALVCQIPHSRATR